MVAVCVAAIDVAVLYAVHAGLGVDVYVARIPSFAIAVTAAYGLNRRFTFARRPRPRGRLRGLLRFYAVFAIGGLLNYAVFALVVAIGGDAGSAATPTFRLPFIGVWLGGLVGMCWNYVLSARLVFPRR